MSDPQTEVFRWNTPESRFALLGVPEWGKDYSFASFPGTVPPEVLAWAAEREPRGLILYGAGSRGKTGLGISILRSLVTPTPLPGERLEQWNMMTIPLLPGASMEGITPDYIGAPCHFVQWDRVLEKYRRERFDQTAWFDGLNTDIDVLMIDDVSAEKVSAYKESFLLRHIEWPFEKKGRALILTMNTHPSKWPDVFGDRTTARLLNPKWFLAYEVKGTGLRTGSRNG